MRKIENIESKFKRLADINLNLETFPIKPSKKKHQTDTDTNNSKKFGEVFTPIWLVDYMIKSFSKIKDPNIKTLDLCAGHGQFSVRLLRFYTNSFGTKVSDFLKNHYFSELQLASCYKLLRLFGRGTNLFIGDSGKLNKVRAGSSGIWCYLNKADTWVCLTNTVANIISDCKSEQEFVDKVDSVIKFYEEKYMSISDEMKEICYSQKTRLHMLSEINDITGGKHGTSWQDKDIPREKALEMLDQVDELEHKSILVLFNTEIVEYLIHNKGVSPSKITYGADFGSELEAQYVKTMYGVDHKLFAKDPSRVRESFKGMMFDVVFSNPPYNDNVNLKILMNMLGFNPEKTSIAKEYVIVHPANWLMDMKNASDLFVNFKNTINGKLKSIIAFNGNTVFDIGLFYPCCIMHLDISGSEKTRVDYFRKVFYALDISDITKYGADWALVKPFFQKIKLLCTDDNIWNHNKISITPGKEYCQFGAIRGTPVREAGSALMYKKDFVSIARKDDGNKRITKSMGDRPGPTFEFDTASERDNFISYLKTDFARFCLSLLKVSGNIYYGELAFIPWLDFTQIWDDEKLFKHFNVSQELQDYMRSFLPDYYEIRSK